MDDRYDLCVVGAGTAGFAAADAARQLGKRVLLVSGPGPLGGTCILRGCMPAKTLFSSTERLGDVAAANELGVDPGPVRVDVPAMLRRKQELTEYFSEDRVAELETFPLLRGRARFVAADAIEVDGRRIAAERFVVATGSIVDPATIGCLRAGDYMTSDDALELADIPKSIAIIGGGPVGCEFAQYFARLGAQVTLLQDDDELLRKEDPDVGAAVRETLVAEGVDVVCSTRIVACRADRTMGHLAYERDGTTHELQPARVMLASGRVPNVAGLALDVAGVAVSPTGGVAVDDYLQSTNPRVYAAGDVLGRRCLVHVAEYGGRLAARNAFGARVPADFDRFEAHAIYTQPQVAVAGLMERECRERGLEVRVRRHPFRDVGKALVSDRAEGFVKMLVDRDDRVRGVAIVGDDAIDLIGEAIALIDRGATAADVANMPHLHPTMGEILGRVADDFAAA